MRALRLRFLPPAAEITQRRSACMEPLLPLSTGANAPEKLLYNVFEKRTAELKAKVKGDSVVERAKWLAKVRDSEGYMAQFLPSDKDGPQILECHSPIINLLEKYPLVARLEQDMFEAVLGTSVRREETRTSGLFECAFYFAA